MNRANKIGWGVIVFLACVALAYAMCGAAHAAPRSLVESLIAAQAQIPRRKEPPVDPRELAEAIANTPKVTADWAALILTVAERESALSARIAAGRCRPLECDRGKAWGLWQIHSNDWSRGVWGSPELTVQANEAAAMLRRAFYTCQKGPLRPDWVARTLNAYAGHSCDASWPGLTLRLATFQRIRRAL